MTITTNATRLCVGGVLHTYSLPSGKGGAMVRYVENDPRDPLTAHSYRSTSLTRATPDGSQTRDFFVLDTLKDVTGKVIVEGLSNDEALAKTLAAPELFWGAEADTGTRDNA